MTVERRKMSRGRILAGATEILNGGVYGDLTVDALARALHMSKSTLYKYFASKEDVIVALVDGACAATDKDLDSLDASGSAHAALDKLVGFLAAHADRLPRAVVVQHARLPDQAQDRVEITRARMGASLKEVVTRGHKMGEFRFEQPALAATAMLASTEAAMVASARGDITMSRSDAVKRTFGLLLPGLNASELTANR